MWPLEVSIFWKAKTLWTSVKYLFVFFFIPLFFLYYLFIQCNKDSCCVHIIGGIKLYLCLLVPAHPVSICEGDIKPEDQQNHIICIKPSVNLIDMWLSFSNLHLEIKFLVRVLPLARCCSGLSAVITWVISKCLWSGWKW